jgi:hypothetical protein
MQPDPAPLETPPANPVATLEEAVNRMVAIDAELALDDGLRYFNLLYLEVTREAVRWVGGGQLEDPRFLEHLAVLFSNAYFRAVEDFEQWRRTAPHKHGRPCSLLDSTGAWPRSSSRSRG